MNSYFEFIPYLIIANTRTSFTLNHVQLIFTHSGYKVSETQTYYVWGLRTPLVLFSENLVLSINDRKTFGTDELYLNFSKALTQ